MNMRLPQSWSRELSNLDNPMVLFAPGLHLLHFLTLLECGLPSGHATRTPPSAAYEARVLLARYLWCFSIENALVTMCFFD